MTREQDIHSVALHGGGNLLEVAWEDGNRESFHAMWLRDNCSCPQCRHPNGQKLTNIGDFPEDVRVVSAVHENGGLRLAFSPDNHSAQFDFAWLRNFPAANALPQPVLWDLESLSVADVSRDYAAVSAGGSPLAEWLGLVVHYGCAVLRGAPAVEKTVCRIVEWFGHVRETNYGRLFEVRAVADPNNLAYTGMALSAHTDNPYRDPPPGLQLLHCLQNSIGGGDSVLVDGFMAAKILAEENAAHYHELSRHAVPFCFCDGAADLRSRLPILEIAPGGGTSAVNFNNRSIAALDIPGGEQPAYYAAYRHFSEILRRPKLNLHFKLEGGDLFIVDNRRILHGRTEFAGGGGRHLQGCYADRDALLSTWRILRGRDKQ